MVTPRMQRRGITLIEMLVATGIFLVGFMGVFGLFLTGVKFRKESEDLVRCSAALSSLVEEFRIDAGREGLGALPPSEFLGDGFAEDLSADDTDDDILFTYRMQPGVWYRVVECTDLQGSTTNATATAVKMRLLVVPFATTDTSLTLSEIGRRLQARDSGGTLLTDPFAIADYLVQRGIALRNDVVIVRHPSWN
jgi:Tfp pilus assembly protein PilV